jgi:hypothetical protein
MSSTTTPKSAPVLICAAGLRPDPAAERARESSFRRGYVQGFVAALDARDIYPVDVCNAHADLLMEWRCHRDVPASYCPPELGALPADDGDGDREVTGWPAKVHPEILDPPTHVRACAREAGNRLPAPADVQRETGWLSGMLADEGGAV